MRKACFELVTDTSHFNPLQLQPRALLQISFNALSRWLKEHLVPFPRLVQDHNVSVAILGASLKYEAPLRFFDDDTLRVEATCRLMQQGSRILLEVEFWGAGARAATVTVPLCPLAIDDSISLAAAPTRIVGELLGRFAEDEIDPGAVPRCLPRSRRVRIESGTRLADGTSSFVVHRHLCEVADQWAFTEVPALVGASRESLAQGQGSACPELISALAKPLRSFEMELTRPYFWFQAGQVDTVAYRHDDGLAMIHQLSSDVPGRKGYGTVLERF